MPFRPNTNDLIAIDGATYRIAEHPAAPGMPYGQTGRRATVYQLRAGDSLRALKVFTPAFRTPRTIENAQRLAPYAPLPGLQAATRTVLTSAVHGGLLQQHPDLEYAVVMPWVAGETWQEIVLNRRVLSPEECRALAASLARILATMERHGLAHCDIAGPNLLITPNPAAVALVDLEELYAPGLPQPEKLPGGSPGYAHRTAPSGLWSVRADRFAGAILLAEMLAWCDERIRAAASDESFFDPAEVQHPSSRAGLMLTTLRARWGAPFAEAFGEAWNSVSLDDCPPLAGWAELLDVAPVVAPVLTVRAPQERLALATIERGEALLELGRIDEALKELNDAFNFAPALGATPYARALLARGTAREADGDMSAALALYDKARQIAPPGALRDEITLILTSAQAKHAPVNAACPACGRALQPEWVRCPYCGTALTSSEQARPTAAAPYPAAVDRSRRRMPGWALALGAGLLLFGAVAGVYATQSRNSAPVPTAVAVEVPTPSPTVAPSATPVPTAAPPTVTPAPPTVTPAPPFSSARDVYGEWVGRTEQGTDFRFRITYSDDRFWFDDMFLDINQYTPLSGECQGTLRVSGFNAVLAGLVQKDFDFTVFGANAVATNRYGMRGSFVSAREARGVFFYDFVFDDSRPPPPNACRATGEIAWQATKTGE